MLSKSLQDVGKELKLPNPFHKMRKLIPGPKYDSKNKEKDRSTFLMNIYVINLNKIPTNKTLQLIKRIINHDQEAFYLGVQE